MARYDYYAHQKQQGRYSRSRIDDDEEEGEILEAEEDQYLGTHYERWNGGSKSFRDGVIEDRHVDYDSRKRRKVGDRVEHKRDVRDRYGCNQERELEKERKRHDRRDVKDTGAKRERERHGERDRRGCSGMDWKETRGKKDIEHPEHKELEHCDEGTIYAEKDVEPKLSELEEEEKVDRVEESRKRRQAILEKYKCKKLEAQNEVEPQIEVPEKEEKASLPVDEVLGDPSVVPELSGCKDVGTDVDSVDSIFSEGKSPVQNIISVSVKTQSAEGVDGGALKRKGNGLQVKRSGPNDNWDNKDGHYICKAEDVLGSRYEVTDILGDGVSSTVVRAKDLKPGKHDPKEVAIKIIHSNDLLSKAAQLEMEILKRLAAADPEDRWHCVRLLSSFKHRNHLCLVLESLDTSLRKVLDSRLKTHSAGFKLTVVRAYAKHLFIALKHLKERGVLHCDIKPENVLVNKATNSLKVCDFGVSMFAGKNEITPYLVSRFYRAPEVILGLPYDHPLDIWSVGCCLYELYSGKHLFPGRSNNDMLRLHMELKGPFPRKMLRKGAFTNQHFDENHNFHSIEEDPFTKKAIERVIFDFKPKCIRTRITGSRGEDPKMLTNFKDLLDKLFVLDPDKRMTVSQALAHPFISANCTKT